MICCKHRTALRSDMEAKYADEILDVTIYCTKQFDKFTLFYAVLTLSP